MPEARLRPIRAIVVAVIAAALPCAVFPGCGTDAQGIDTCRSIEQERCRQALACPDQFHITTQDQVTDCVRFYRDECLHGLTGSDVGGPQLDGCIKTIQAAGACAAGGAATLADCQPAVSQQTTIAVSPCDLLAHPEEAIECAFLGPPATQPSFDAATEQTADAADESTPDAGDESTTDAPTE